MTRATDQSTRDRLLQTAGRMFAEKGFRGTTVRDICRRARANLAAVNYHFGGKRKLYAEVLASTFARIIEKYPPDVGQAEARTPEERLYAFVRAFLLRMLDPEQPAWHRRLIAREMAEPSPEMHRVHAAVMKRPQRILRGILVELLGPRTTPGDVDLNMASIAGQCLFYHRRHAVSRVLRRVRLTPESVDRLAHHITDFSLNGLKGRRGGL